MTTQASLSTSLPLLTSGKLRLSLETSMESHVRQSAEQTQAQAGQFVEKMFEARGLAPPVVHNHASDMTLVFEGPAFDDFEAFMAGRDPNTAITDLFGVPSHVCQ